MKRLFHLKTFLFFFFFLQIFANAQSLIGVGFGTFNIPGASRNFKGFGPTVKYEHIADNQRVAAYVDVSYFSKDQDEGTVPVYDNTGTQVGNADAKTKFSYLYSQMGMKAIFFGDADEKKILGYAGGGIALVYANTTTSYKSTVSTFDDDKINRFIFGFHLCAGLQYNFHPVILELRGNLDIDLKPLVNDGASDVSNVLANTRLCILIPLSK